MPSSKQSRLQYITYQMLKTWNLASAYEDGLRVKAAQKLLHFLTKGTGISIDEANLPTQLLGVDLTWDYSNQIVSLEKGTTRVIDDALDDDILPSEITDPLFSVSGFSDTGANQQYRPATMSALREWAKTDPAFEWTPYSAWNNNPKGAYVGVTDPHYQIYYSGGSKTTMYLDYVTFTEVDGYMRVVLAAKAIAAPSAAVSMESLELGWTVYEDNTGDISITLEPGVTFAPVIGGVYSTKGKDVIVKK